MARKNKIVLTGNATTGIDKRGLEVKAYQDAEGNWYVERNNNGAVHPEPCKDEKEAAELFKQHCESE